MNSKTPPSFHAILVLLVGVTVLATNAFAANTPEQLRQVESLVTNWQAQFGPVNFYDDALFQCMNRLQAKPKSAFTRFQDQKLSEGLLSHHRTWLGKIFKGRFGQTLTNLPAVGLYVNEGRTEPSLLLYELEFDGNAVSITESYNVFLLTVRPTGFVPDQGIAPELVERILFEWVNLNKLSPPVVVVPQFQSFDEVRKSGALFREESDGRWTLERRPRLFEIPYTSPEEIVKPFNLPELLKMGDVFTNRSKTETRLPLARDWQEYIFGFVSGQGLSLLLYKEESYTHNLYSPYDFNWLNKGLFQADGKTLVDPPRNQQANDPDRIGQPPTRSQ